MISDCYNLHFESQLSAIYKFENYVVIASCDKIVKAYANNIPVMSIELDDVIIRFTSYKDILFGFGIYKGIYIINDRFELLKKLRSPFTIANAVYMNGLIITSTWSKALMVFNVKNGYKGLKNLPNDPGDEDPDLNDIQYDYDYEIDENLSNGKFETDILDQISKVMENDKFIRLSRIKLCIKHITVVQTFNDMHLLAFEDVVKVFNESFECIFTKSFSGVVNAAILRKEGFFVGLINGKIYYESFLEPLESFVFNAHFLNNDNSRIYHSTNCLWYDDDYLYSGGSDGKICKWNVSKHCLECILLNSDMDTQQIVLSGDYIFAIFEDLKCQRVRNKVVIVKVK